MNEHILIIDDDKKLCIILSEYLAAFNFKISFKTDPALGLQFLCNNPVDIIILDVMLPGMDGFTLCKKIREKWNTPIIMLTARGEVTDTIVGLEIGADDYMSKPFEPRELVARISAILRRQHPDEEQRIKEFDDLRIDFNKRSIEIDGKRIDLTTLEFEVLTLLVSQPDRVFTRDQIQTKIKGYELHSFDRSIDVLMSRLRQKLKDDPGNPRYIKTIWGTGYVFIGKSNGTKAKN
ncbi:MAG: response regulator transcription factor [Spirochaetales bacterium]|nr:response regulator transcription factor [Spirochaetales bacterium]